MVFAAETMETLAPYGQLFYFWHKVLRTSSGHYTKENEIDVIKIWGKGN